MYKIDEDEQSIGQRIEEKMNEMESGIQKEMKEIKDMLMELK